MYASMYKQGTGPRRGSHRHPDTITYWKAGGLDMYGQPSWSAPITIPARVEQGSRVYYTENGREVRGRYYVFIESDQLKEGDIVYMGRSGDVSPPTSSLEVKQQRIIPSLLGNVKEYRYAM